MSMSQHIRVFVSVVFMALLVGFVLNGTKMQTESVYIDYIQMQSWPYKDKETIIEVVEQHFEHVYWEYYVARSGQHVVQMTGILGKGQTILQFVVQEDLSRYEIGAMKLNDVVLSREKKWLYVQEITG